jgi:NAD(P)-dependent dehydrogenase (short-subunit alcohol dehydrogenase family)
MDIKGQAAIVTGGASGLGAATAEMLAGAGAKVACLDINLAGAQAVAAKIGGIAVQCDVTSSDQAVAALAQARAQHGAARILMNCAGIGPARRIVGRDGPMPLAEFEKVIQINLIGTFNMMRLVAADMQGLPALADGERGVIISTASVAAFEGQIGQPAYTASKGSVAALTMPAAREVRAVRHSRQRHRTGHLPHADADGAAGGGTESLAAAVPFPALLGRPEQFAALVRHHREHLHQRRGDPPRRRAAHGAALTGWIGGTGMLVSTVVVASNGAIATRPGSSTPAISACSMPAPGAPRARARHDQARLSQGL